MGRSRANSFDLNRRQFLKGAAASVIGFPYIVPASVLGRGAIAPSDKITLGCIGLGGQGTFNLRQFLSYADCRVTAVCDVASRHNRGGREQAKQIVDKAYGSKSCAAYVDFRQLLADKGIDAVMVATPDHWHVLISLAAARAGKDMYVEKTLALGMRDRKALRAEIKRYGRVFQFGTQQRSEENFRFGCELVLNGRIGKLRKITVGSPTSVSTGNFRPMLVPSWMTDYDMWLGPAPYKPYSGSRFGYWSHISDYSLGWIAHWGLHHIDIAQWGNGTDDSGPVEIQAQGTFPPDGLCDTALAWEAKMKYANGVELLFTDKVRNRQGVLFSGTDGWVFVKRGIIDAHPKELLHEKIGADERRLPVSTSHHRNFLDCVRTRRQPVAPIAAAVRSDTICHLADIAMRLGRKLRWDPARERFERDSQANAMLERPMRSPWHL